MKIILSPQVRFDASPLTLIRDGNNLTVNGETIALQTDPGDGTFPHPALVSWPHLEDGDWVVSLLYPIPPDASETTRFPQPLEMTGDGEIEILTDLPG
jgi:hypothetical protein